MEPRRSSRLKATSKLSEGPPDLSPPPGRVAEPIRKPRAKRKKVAEGTPPEEESGTPAPKKRKLKGSLANLPDMPLDVLFHVSPLCRHANAPLTSGASHIQVFRCLSPLDLLRVARVSKPFRALLLNPSNRHVWLHVIKAMPKGEGLPKCPSDMAEPAYMSLMLERFCSVSQTYLRYEVVTQKSFQYCGVGNTQTALFSIRKRSCVACFGSSKK
jgi:hypothetical protein